MTRVRSVSNNTLLLASGSPRRADLLRQLGVSFDICAVDIDESPHMGETPAVYVERMAVEKSKAAQVLFGERAILTADTAIALDGEILGKPSTLAEAADMLHQLSGREHKVLSAVCVVRGSQKKLRLSATTVQFEVLDNATITEYLRCNESLDKAAGYAIQGAAAAFITSIHGSYTGVVGLPLCETRQLLEQFAIPYWKNS